MFYKDNILGNFCSFVVCFFVYYVFLKQMSDIIIFVYNTYTLHTELCVINSFSNFLGTILV